MFGQVNDLRQRRKRLGFTKEEFAAPATTIQVGDTVRLFSGGNTGVVQEFRGNQAVVLIEGKVFHLSRKQLQRAESSSPRQARRAQRKANKAANQTIAVTDASAPTLDLRVWRPLRPRRVSTDSCKCSSMLIALGAAIHGIGTGALRKKTLRYLSEGPWNVAFRGGFSTEGADGVTVVRGGLMQTIEAGLKLFEWQYDVIAERNAVRSVFSGRSTSYQVFVMRLLEEGLYRFVILCPTRPLEHRAGLGEFLHRTNTSLPLGVSGA